MWNTIDSSNNNNNNNAFLLVPASPTPATVIKQIINGSSILASDIISNGAQATAASMPPLTADVLKASALFLLVVWTILANFLVFIVLYKNPRLQTVPNLLVGNLALSDFCLALIVLPLSSVYVLNGKWLFNDTLCQIFVSADILCSTASIWNLSIVGLDRYWAITSPVAYLNKRNKKTACLMIVSVWSFSALISLAPLLGWKQVAEHGNLVLINGSWQCTFLDLPSYTVYSATGSFFIPTLLMFFVYFKIYQAFAKHRARQIYRQKVIRRHIESTILHEISHILPTSDEFAKDADEDEEIEEEGEAKDSNHAELERELRNTEQTRHVTGAGGMSIPVIYEEDEEEEEEWQEDEENEDEGNDDEETLAGTVEVKASADKAQQHQQSSGTAATTSTPTKVTFRRRSSAAATATATADNQQPVGTISATVLLKNNSNTGKTPTMQWRHPSKVEHGATILLIKNSPSKNNGGDKNAGGIASKVKNSANNKELATNTKSEAAAENSVAPRPPPSYEKVWRHKKRKELKLRKSLQTKPRAISAAKERRGVRVLGIILGCFTLCWTPFFIMYVVVQFCSNCTVNPHIEMFITWLGYSNSAMNPIIYTVFNRDYQIALKRLFVGRRVGGTSGIRSTLQRPMFGLSTR